MKLSVIFICLFLAGCATSTMPFDPTKKVTAEEIRQAQAKSLLPVGIKGPYSGMPCFEYIEYKIAYCEATLSCNPGQYKRLTRKIQRMSKIYSGKCYYSREHIEAIFRIMRHPEF